MPQSLVLSLETQSTVLSKHLQGHALQQLFFTLVDTVDPELGHVLRRDKKNCSYTLSAIQPGSISGSVSGSMPISIPNPDASSEQFGKAKPARKFQTNAAGNISFLQYAHTAILEAKAKCWWRISFLDDALFDHLVFLWSQLSNEIFPLGSASVKIEHVFLETPSTKWASSCSYRDLYEQASAQERNIHLQFITPAAFNIGETITPLPTADAVFQPLRKYWNRYSGLAFAPSLTSDIVPVAFDIQTQPVQTVLRNSFQTLTGCTGHISFRIGGSGDPLITKRINALTDFTGYCGIGINTRLGMGIVKRLQHSKIRAESGVTIRPTA